MNNQVLRILVLIGAACWLPSSAGAATQWSAADYDLYPGDFNGDGRTDLLYVAKDPSNASGIALSDGSGPNISLQSWLSNHLGIPWHSNIYSVHVGRFNDDDRADLFLQRNTPGEHFLLFADPNGRFTQIAQSIPASYLALTWSADQHRMHVGDFNGDGASDLFLQATRANGADVVQTRSCSPTVTERSPRTPRSSPGRTMIWARSNGRPAIPSSTWAISTTTAGATCWFRDCRRSC